MESISKTLKTRRNAHGDYATSARFKSEMLDLCERTTNWHRLDGVAKETIRMIVEKLGRVLHGDPTFTDHWHDIAGYATLMEHTCDDTPIDLFNTVEEGTNG